MQTNFKKLIFTALVMLTVGMTALFAQGMGGGGGPGGGGNGGPGGGGMGNDSTQCDTSGGGWDHDGPGWGWDSTGHDSSGYGWHHGPGHGWGHGDSLSLDSIFVSGVISTLEDTVFFGGGHHFPGAPDSGEFIRTFYFLDADGDELADYQLMHLPMLGFLDSTFVLPVAGDQADVVGFLFSSEDHLDRILVLDLTPSGDAGSFGSLMATDALMEQATHRLESRNYPNPFNPSTMIEFTLVEAGHTSLKVYDIRGAEVAVLANTEFSAGAHTLQFNPQGLSAGTYLYVLEANGQREVRRIAYLK